MRKLQFVVSTILVLLTTSGIKAQSLEIMPGTERVFTDVQWLKTIDTDRKWSVFSRTRATVDYDNNTNLFSGAYLNYTTKSGIGGTVLGRISGTGAGADAGVHLFKASKKFLVYALASIEINSELGYSWFSIARYRPELTEKIRLYSSLELFSTFNKSGHVASVQRMRVGLEISGYQFGVGLNLSGFGKDYSTTDTNPGLFIRKEF